MAPATHLPGKDACLEDTIDRATSLLKSMNLETEAISWQNPAPDCWSVHLRATSCAHLYTNGKGTSKPAALASALGEFFERLATNFFFADCFLDDRATTPPFFFYPDEIWLPPGKNPTIPKSAPDGTALLTADLRKFYNPVGELNFEHLCDNNTNSTLRGICALPFTDLTNGRKVYFPVSFLNNLYVSNGMAAGNSRTECCSQALSEIIERYVKNIIIRRGLSLPDVPLAVLKGYPRLYRIIDRLADEGLIVRVKDGSLGGQFPVICALLTDAVNGGVYAAFGANYRFETAIERTLTELLQGRNLEGLHHFQPPCHDLVQVADPFNLESHFVDSDGLLAWTMFRDKPDFPFSPWDFKGSTEEEFIRLQSLISGLGTRLFRAEYLHCGMYSCRILVPGISEIYPIDDLVYNNRSAGAALRPDLLRLPHMDRTELADFLDRLETLGLGDHQLLAHTIGILFDDDSTWSSLRIGELKALLLLALHNHKEALHWCDWCLDYTDLPAERRRLYRLLHTLLGFSLAGQRTSDYSDSLRLLYEGEEVQTGQNILDGRTTFPGLVFAASWTEIAKQHGKLLQIYDTLSDIKASEKRT
ncbi:MAG: YcaO-like family protein [Proteobacteria bacterium]|nr:YcaO-like family protein [Pseudomonadota bacterium]